MEAWRCGLAGRRLYPGDPRRRRKLRGMAIDAETERQEDRRAKRALLFAVIAAVAVAGAGLYGFGKLSESVEQAGLQPKKRAW